MNHRHAESLRRTRIDNKKKHGSGRIGCVVRARRGSGARRFVDQEFDVLAAADIAESRTAPDILKCGADPPDARSHVNRRLRSA
jgi:hypothetical protein